MPDQCCWRESYDSSSLLQSPTKINIIARDSETGVKAFYSLKGFSSKCHVATWDVLSYLVGKKNRVRSRCVRDGLCLPSVICWRGVRASSANKFSISQRQSKESEPVFIGICIIVNKCNDFFCGRVDSVIACLAKPAIFSVDQPKRVTRRDLGSRVGRPVINHDDFQVGVVHCLQTV